MVEMLQRWTFKKERFQYKHKHGNFFSVLPRAEDVALPGLLQALQLAARCGGALALPSLVLGCWPENLGIPQLAARRWCN